MAVHNWQDDYRNPLKYKRDRMSDILFEELMGSPFLERIPLFENTIDVECEVIENEPLEATKQIENE